MAITEKCLQVIIAGLRWLLWPISLIFGGVNLAKRWFYPYGRQVVLPARVVSVGNLSVGGTGKTPTLLWLARQLQGRGLRVGLVVRSYKARQQQPALVDLSREDLGPAQYGDEAWWLKGQLPMVPVACGRTKAEIANFLFSENPDLQWILVDDGFQHLALHRDVDLLLISENDSARDRWPVPTGRGREFFRAKSAADLLLWVEKESEDLKKLQAPTSEQTVFDEFHARLNSGPLPQLENVSPGTSVFAFCGLARPEPFFAGLRLRYPHLNWEFRAFADHHPYSVADLQNLQRSKARAFVTTEKDFVKIRELWQTQQELLVIPYEIEIDRPEILVDEILRLGQQIRKHPLSLAERVLGGVVLGFGLMLSWLPRRLLRSLGASLGVLWFDIFRIRRQVVLGNLDLAFPEVAKQIKTQWGRYSVYQMGANFAEFFTLPHLNKSWIAKNAVFEGLEHFDAALAQSKGVYLLSMHLGHGDLAASLLCRKGYQLHLISKFFRSRWLNDLWFGVRGAGGMKFIEPHGAESPFRILRAIKEKAAVIFVLDQFMGKPFGVETTFFGHKTGTAYGLALFALKTRSPVVPVYSFEGDDGKVHVVFESAMDLTSWLTGNKEEVLQNVTQAFTDKIEECVRKHPQHWMWVHRRWKTYE